MIAQNISNILLVQRIQAKNLKKKSQESYNIIFLEIFSLERDGLVEFLIAK